MEQVRYQTFGSLSVARSIVRCPGLPFRVAGRFLPLQLLAIFFAGSVLVSGEDSPGPQSNTAAPFVGAFERLARHQDIDAVLAGRLLISELSCTACHADNDPSLSPKHGPDLRAAGKRLSTQWMQRYIANPQSVKPGTTMPDLMQGYTQRQRADAAAAIVAYLGTMLDPLPEIKGTGLHPVPHQFWNLGRIEQGRDLYHRVGCVACHQPDAAYEAAELPSSQIDQLLELLDPEELEELGLGSAVRLGPIQPLGNLAEQHSLQSLTLFLLDPESVRPGSRMPNFKLPAVDAADIAAYLMRRSTDAELIAELAPGIAGQPTNVETSLIAEGRRLFVQLQCVNCHRTDKGPAEPAAAMLAQVDWRNQSGCLNPSLANSERTTSPAAADFGLDAEQRTAISAALADRTSNKPSEGETESAAHELAVSLLRFNCYACHERDGLGGVARDRRGYFETVNHEDLGDEGRLPPLLTGVGQKAVPAWLNRVLLGNGEIRPHMHARMPKFPAAEAKKLAALLAQVDRASTIPAAESKGRAELAQWPNLDDVNRVDVGRNMMDAGCVQCHRFRGEALPGVVGVDLYGIADRVEPQWFRQFLLNPGAIKPRTRMPSFFPDGVSQNTKLLDGDADRQIAAMWGYLKSLSKEPLPEKIEEVRSRDYELRPVDQPIILRTFMRDAPTHAIAVGFPQQVHFAFDAETMRLTTAWRGRFLDAQGTWFVRAAPPADPLGDDVISISDQDLFGTGDRPGIQRRFRGFKLDEQRVPTFLYEVGNLLVEDRISPLESSSRGPATVSQGSHAGTIIKPGLRRVIRLKRMLATQPSAQQSVELASPLALRLLSGNELTPIGVQSLRNERGLTVTVPEMVARRAEQDGVSWKLPLDSLFNEQRVDDPSSDGGAVRAESVLIAVELFYTW
jgi:mono/diheme cytochrome c family protein